MVNKITGFFEKYRFLSNYYVSDFYFEGKLFKTGEHAFHYMKVDASRDLPENDPDSWRYQILNAETPGEAKKLGRRCPMRPDWDEKKLEIVKSIVLAKFLQNPKLAEKLIATGNAYLEETNTWNDKFWGVCDGIGENHLGKILMEVREILIRKQTFSFEEKARISKDADETLENILNKNYNNFDQYEEVSKITDLEIAKLVIKRLLDKLQ